MDRPTQTRPTGEPVPLRDAEVPDFLESHRVAVLAFLDDQGASGRLRERLVLVAARLARPDVAVGLVDVRADRLVAQAVGVRSVPTTLVFVAGEAVDRLMGAPPAEVVEETIRARLPG